MNQSCWSIQEETGFLLNPDPIVDITAVSTPFDKETAETLQALANTIPKRIANKTLRYAVQQLPTFNMTILHDADGRLVERLFQMYAHFAQAYIWCEQKEPMKRLPAGVAIPFVQLANLVERPPIIVYAMTALANYQRIDPNGPIAIENLRVVQKLIDIPDESWFHLIHVQIEATAGAAIVAAQAATVAVEQDDDTAVITHLTTIATTFDRMMAIFKRMPEGCSPDLYYHTFRPYLFGFDGIIYEGVAEYGEKPQTFLGETGAQSSVIPALKTFLGLRHAHGGLTDYLELMKTYMPAPHRHFLAEIDPNHIRGYVLQRDEPNLKELFNLCLEKMMAFRSLHLHFAQAYIASKVKDPRGTGGTDFMRWLKQLRDETAEQMV